MAQIPNMVYPHARSQQYSAKVMNATSMFTGSAFSGSHMSINAGTSSGSALYYLGCEILRGFTASGSIALWQPVMVVPETAGQTLKVMGAIAIKDTGIIGVAAAVATHGNAVDIIVRGIVPMIGSGAITLGGRVMYCPSGAIHAINDFTFSPTASGSMYYLGRAITTGAAASGWSNVYVNPMA